MASDEIGGSRRQDALLDTRRVLIVRAVQEGWVMGEDLVITVDGTETLADIQDLVKQRKGVGVTRQVLHKEGVQKPLEDKFLDWDLNRMGLYNGSVIEVHPLKANTWLWHPLQWYEDAVLKQVLEKCAVTAKKNFNIPLAVAESSVPMPPPLRHQSLRALLRKYPEKVLMEHDMERGIFFISQNATLDLPLSY